MVVEGRTLEKPAGIYPMLFAYFAGDGALRLDAFAPQVEAAIAARAAGVAVLGLGTEVGKLGPAERRDAVEAVVAAVRGRVPVAVTVAGTSLPEATAAARHACDAGAAWLILQPPPPPASEEDVAYWFAAIADAVPCPVAIQNAPEFLGIGLSPDAILRLAGDVPRLVAVKAESSALLAARLVDRLGGRLAVLNGRAGLELPDNLRGGVAGMVPGIETADLQVAAFAAMAAGDEAAGEAAYARMLPLLTFLMQGVAQFTALGKIVAARRLGIDAGRDRRPAMAVDARARAWCHRYADALGPLPQP